MADSPSRRDLESLARAWIELWNGGDLSRFESLHSPEFVDHSPDGRSPDRAGFKQGLVELYQALPDLSTVIDALVIDEELATVAVRWSSTGTHRGALLGFDPTGRCIRLRGIEIIRIADGMIVERWGEWDGLDLLHQLQQG